MKELDELKKKCVQAMQDVDNFVSKHYDELCNEVRKQHNVKDDWQVRIVSNCGVVHGCYRQSDKDKWFRVIYNNGFWLDNNKSQKSIGWSEEDERNALYISAALQCYYRLREDRNNINGQENLDKAINWLYNKLKFLKPQPKQEWSEEDEELCQDCLDVFEALGNGLEPLEDYHKLYDWLIRIKQREQQ